MSAVTDIRAAIAAAPSEQTVGAALRLSDDYRAQIAALQTKVSNLIKSNAALRVAAEDATRKAAVLDHALNVVDSGLVLADMAHINGKWHFDPISTLDEAVAAMDRDIAAGESDGDSVDCQSCGGTGEGQHEGQSCASCAGKGF